MKLFSAVLLSALLASQVAAGPIRFLRRASQNQNAGNSTQSQSNDNGKTKQMSPASGNTVGAAYFITNEPDGNFLVSAEIGSDGKLTLRQAVNTGGLGSHANVQNSGPDPLLSAGSVTTSAQSNIVATVNAGSNTLSIFSIDQNDPTKVTQIGQPVGSGGEFPISVAINNAGDTVCALNGGEINGIGCFKVDQKNNLVTPISQTVRSLNLKQTTPPTGPANTASQIIFSEDNSQLIASVKGTDKSNPGFLAVFDVAKDGSVSSNFQKVQPPNAQEAALFSLNVIKGKGKNAVLAADPSVGFDIFTLGGVSGNNNQSNNNAAAIQAASVPIGGQTLTTHSSFSNKIGDFFLTDIAASTLTEVNVDGNLKGSVITRLQLNKDSAPIDNSIATVGNKDFMYILSANATAIDVLSLDGQGKVTGVQRLDIAGPAQGANLKINANNLQGMATFVKK